MGITPEEAKEKNCPMCFNGADIGATCAADRCMAWEWTRSEWDTEKGEAINVEGRCGFINPSSILVRQD